MSSVTKTQAEIDAQAALDAIYDAANARFIANADIQIQQAIDQGLFFVNCTTSDDVDPAAIFTYYTDLGYQVRFPDYPKNSTPTAPPDSNSGFWVSSWLNTGLTRTKLEKPYRFLIIFKN